MHMYMYSVERRKIKLQNSCYCCFYFICFKLKVKANVIFTNFANELDIKDVYNIYNYTYKTSNHSFNPILSVPLSIYCSLCGFATYLFAL